MNDRKQRWPKRIIAFLTLQMSSGINFTYQRSIFTRTSNVTLHNDYICALTSWLGGMGGLCSAGWTQLLQVQVWKPWTQEQGVMMRKHSVMWPETLGRLSSLTPFCELPRIIWMFKSVNILANLVQITREVKAQLGPSKSGSAEGIFSLGSQFYLQLPVHSSEQHQCSLIILLWFLTCL